jgi:hypothetical protein
MNKLNAPLLIALLSGCSVSSPLENALAENINQVNPAAQFDYAVFLYDEGNHYLQKAVEGGNKAALKYFELHSNWIQTALEAEAGDINKQRALGIAYSNPSSPVSAEPQPIKAVKWLVKAAQSGDSMSAFYLGGMFAIGDVVETDQNMATDWYLKSASLGNADSMYILSMRYNAGTGVKANSERSQYWRSVAAHSGHTIALKNITSDYSTGTNVKQNDAWTVFWASKLGNEDQLISNSLLNLPRLKPIHDDTRLQFTFTKSSSSTVEPITVSRTTDLYALHYEGDWVEVYSPLHNAVRYVEISKTRNIVEGRKSSLKPSEYHLCEISCQYGSCVQRNLDGSTATYTLDINRINMCLTVNYL